ncbi:hypothetical protein [Streptomyces hirsutus]|uniref:hypothetical protein n=1 Tax=Streptomyces hirsutus TaxID=35620 RepID=UPI0036658805
MLASLLPGMRHLRTPFSLGVLCAFELWVFFGEKIPTRSEADGLVKRLYSLAEISGRPIVVAALAFVLYLIGGVIRIPIAKLQYILDSALRKPAVLSRNSRWQLEEYAKGAFERRRETVDVDVKAGELSQKIVREFSEIRISLIANHLDIYMEHDRLESEAELRINLAIYSFPLLLSPTFVSSIGGLVGVFIAILLIENGRRSLKEANAILVQAVIAGVVQSPSYETELDKDMGAGTNISITRRRRN